MKKILLFGLMMLLLCGCEKRPEAETTAVTESTDSMTIVEITEAPEETVEITIPAPETFTGEIQMGPEEDIPEDTTAEQVPSSTEPSSAETTPEESTQPTESPEWTPPKL